MKKIDDNQLRVINYLVENSTATNKELMPLIDWSESHARAYLAVMAKLKIAGIVQTSESKNGITYRLTRYGKENFE